jgi:hypothetical protein
MGFVCINDASHESCNFTCVARKYEFGIFGPEFVYGVLNFTRKFLEERMVNESVETVESVL